MRQEAHFARADAQLEDRSDSDRTLILDLSPRALARLESFARKQELEPVDAARRVLTGALELGGGFHDLLESLALLSPRLRGVAIGTVQTLANRLLSVEVAPPQTSKKRRP